MSGAAEAAAPTLLLVGCGKMGGALLDGWLERRSAGRLLVVEPGPAAARFAGAGVEVFSAPDQLPPDVVPTVVVIAVKPQAIDAVLPAYRRYGGGDAVFLSIVAGKTLGYFARQLGTAAPVVRAMPNTPAAIGRGIAVACPNAVATASNRALCDVLLAAVGEVGWVEDEALMDAVTAVSGSGPAYVFLLIECLAKAGVAAGLPPDLAARLARATVAGAGELARRSPEDPATLRENVTSPGGTTRAALDVLMAADGLAPLMARAVAAAARRSRELAD